MTAPSVTPTPVPPPAEPSDSAIAEPRRSYGPVLLSSLVGGVVHVALIPLFLVLDVLPLALYNVVSAPVFAVSYLLNERDRHGVAALLVVLEIVVHQSLAVYYLGWESGFQYWLYVGAGGVFVAHERRLSVGAPLMLLCLATLVVLHVMFSDAPPVADVPDWVLEALSVMNHILPLLLLVILLVYFARAVERAERALREAHRRTRSVLENTLPASIAQRLEQRPAVLADGLPGVTILFADIVGFTKMAERTEPARLVSILDELFRTFDAIVDELGLEKIKTIGDAYMAAAGAPEPRSDHVAAAAELGLAMRDAFDRYIAERELDLAMRIGIHTGAVIAGVIGKRKFAYDLWGDTVNVAARMESHGLPGEIQASEQVFQALADDFLFDERGDVEIKGKGRLRTYLLRGRRP